MEYLQRKVQALPENVRSMIRTGVALISFAQAVEELVLNAVDAKASSIAVRVDLSCFKVQVVDNGDGISLDQFALIGERYSTSKCHIADDLENLKYFGYRGEALASLQNASTFLEILSRPKNSCTTYSKCFQKGECLGISQPSQHRPSYGTTITAYGLFYNLPVRRNGLNTVLETEKIRYRLAGIALMWPKISISLRDDSVGNVILQTQKCSGISAIFSQLFTPARAKGLMEVSIHTDDFRISGLVSKESYSRKDLQFVFVNKRLVLKSSIHKQVNKIFRRSLVLRRKGTSFEELDKMRSTSQTGFPQGSPSKQLDQYAIFVLNIECSFKEYDITFDPSKTLVEFRDWPKLIHTLQDMLYGFLRKENLLPPNAYSPSRSDDKVDGFEKVSSLLPHEVDQNGDFTAPQQFNMTNFESMFSEPVCRLSINNVDDGRNGARNISTNEDNDKPPNIKEVCTDFQINQQNSVKRKVGFEVSEHSCQVSANNFSQSSTFDSRPSRIISLRGNNFHNPFTVGHSSVLHPLSKTKAQQQSKDCPTKPLSSNDTASCSGFVDEEEPLVRTSNRIETESEHPLKGSNNGKQKITLGKASNYSSTMKGLREINPFQAKTTPPNVTKLMVHTLQDLKMCSHKHTVNLNEILKTPKKATRRKSFEVEQDSSPSKQQCIEGDEKSSNHLSSNNSKTHDTDSDHHMQIDTTETMKSTSSSISLSDSDNYSSYQSSRIDICNKEKENPRRPVVEKMSRASKLARIMKGTDKSGKSQSSKHVTRLKYFTYAKEGKCDSSDSKITHSESVLSEYNSNNAYSKEENSRIGVSKETTTETDCVSCDNSLLNYSKNVTSSTDTCKHQNTMGHSEELPFAMYSTMNKASINTPELSVVVSIPISSEQNSDQPSCHVTNVEENLCANYTDPPQTSEELLPNFPIMEDKESINLQTSDIRSMHVRDINREKELEHFSVNKDKVDRSSELSQGFDVTSDCPDLCSQSNTPFFSTKADIADDAKKAYYSQGFTVRTSSEKSSSSFQETESNSPFKSKTLQVMSEKCEDPLIEITKKSIPDEPSHGRIMENSCYQERTAEIELQNCKEVTPLITNESLLMNTETLSKKDFESPSQTNTVLVKDAHSSHMSDFKTIPVVNDSFDISKRIVAPGGTNLGDISTLKGVTDCLSHGNILSGEIQGSNKNLKAMPFAVTKNENLCTGISLSAHGGNSQQKSSSIEDQSSSSSNEIFTCMRTESNKFDVIYEENVDIEHTSNGSSIPCGQRETMTNKMNNDNSSSSSSIPCGQKTILTKCEDISLSSLSSSSLNGFTLLSNSSKNPVFALNAYEMQGDPYTPAVNVESQNKAIIVNESFETNATNGDKNEIHQKASTENEKDSSTSPHVVKKKTLITLSNAQTDLANQVTRSHSLTVSIPDSTVKDKTCEEYDKEEDCDKLPTKDINIIIQGKLSAQRGGKSKDTELAKANKVLAIPDSVSPSISTNVNANKNAMDESEALTHWCRVTPSVSGTSVFVNNKSGHSISEEQWSKLASSEPDILMADHSKNTHQELGESNMETNDDLSEENMSTFSKWRDARKLTYDADQGGDVASVITDWTDTVFLKYKLPPVLSLYNRDEMNSKNPSQTFNQVEFTKEMLHNVGILGQVDNKFLACIIRERNAKSKRDDCSPGGTVNSPLLVFFDQHAVHERIRLELLTSEVYESSEESGIGRIKRERISKPLLIHLNQDDLRVMRAFTTEFDRIGVEFAVEEGSREKIVVHSVPLCMTESKRIKGALKEKIEELVSEHIDLLKSTNGTCGKLPLTIHRILCSQACRGAVKFGDPLSQSECVQLLSQLTSCSLPFQCAHGRPSVAPLINLSDLEVEPKDLVRRPRLQNITRLMKAHQGAKTKNL